MPNNITRSLSVSDIICYLDLWREIDDFGFKELNENDILIGENNMKQEIVQRLPSLYPLQTVEEEALLNPKPHERVLEGVLS